MRLLVQEGEYTILTSPECEAPVEVCVTSDQLRDASRAEGRDQERQRVLRLIDGAIEFWGRKSDEAHPLTVLRRQVESGEEL